MDPVGIAVIAAVGASAVGALYVATAPTAQSTLKQLKTCEERNSRLRRLVVPQLTGEQGFKYIQEPDPHAPYETYRQQYLEWDAKANGTDYSFHGHIGAKRRLAPFVEEPSAGMSLALTAQRRARADILSKCELRGAWLRAAVVERHGSAPPGDSAADVELWERGARVSVAEREA